MKQAQFEEYLTQLRALTPTQRQQLSKVLAQAPKEHKLPSQVLQCERQIDQNRTCPYYGASGSVRNGRTSGLIRFRCRATGCGKTYTALSRTGLAHLRCRDKWEAYQDCLRQRMTLHASAEHCGINYRTAFLWRHRMRSPVHLPDSLTVHFTETAPLGKCSSAIQDQAEISGLDVVLPKCNKQSSSSFEGLRWDQV